MTSLNPSLLILDAHHSALDIIATAAWARRVYNPRLILMPLAGYSYHVPLMRTVIKYIAAHYQITFMPVYRHEEIKPTHIFMRFLCWFYPTGITADERTLANNNYVTTSIKAITSKGSIVIVAPYGSPIYFGGEIKYSVRKLMELNMPTILTHSHFSFTKLRYQTVKALYDRGRDLLSQYHSLG